MSRYNLQVHKGRPHVESFQVLDDSDAPVDLTGATIESEVRALGGTLQFAFGVTLTDAANGEFELDATDAQTGGLTADGYFYEPVSDYQYVYDIFVTYADSSTDTLVEGYVHVVQGVTE